MENGFPSYSFDGNLNDGIIARFVRLDNPNTYPFDEFHAHQYHEMLVFTKGGGRHNINFQEYSIEHYSAHLLAAGDVHMVERGLQSEGFALVYNDAFLVKLKELNPHVAYFESLGCSGVLPLSETAEEEAFRMLIPEIIRNQHDRSYCLNLIAAFLTKLVLSFPDRPKENAVAKRYPLVVRLIGLINRHFTEHLSATAYAEKAGCSLSSLEKKVKAATGKTIAQLQQEKLLNEAKRQLIMADSGAKEAAYHLGFQTESYFNYWFKKLTGQTPGKFRYNVLTGLSFLSCIFQVAAEF
ncbi:MAG TPA: AraC family transcriptional regulator [Edaphocola sp.]|nr:AraC family transcriptional regulator [Edaphocola sp.]